MMTGRNKMGIDGFWSGGKFSVGCLQLFLVLAPNLLFFSVERFQKRRKAKLKPKLIDLHQDADQESILKPKLIDLPQDTDQGSSSKPKLIDLSQDAVQVNILNPNLIDPPQETLENILGFKLVDLPREILEDILLRLPTKLICCIRCASRTVSTIIDNPSFATLHRSRLLNYSGMNSVPEVPQLMICYQTPTRNGYELLLQPLKYNGRRNLEKPNSHNLPVSKIVTVSNFGYSYCLEFVFYNLIFFKTKYPDGDPSFLLNSLCGEVLKIPEREIINPRDFNIPLDYYGMGFDNNSKTYKLVCVTFDLAAEPVESYPAVAYIYELGQSSSCSSWREIQAVPPELLSTHNVCAHGDMHWRAEEKGRTNIGGRSRIISFDFEKEEFCWTPHPTLGTGSNYFMSEQGHLLNLKGSLAMVDTSIRASISIWVMKNYERKEWVLDYQISLTHKGFGDFRCGEWANGIFFVQKDGTMKYHPSVCCHFLDTKLNSMRRVEKPWWGMEKYLLNCTGSLLSLKMFGTLVRKKKYGIVIN